MNILKVVNDNITNDIDLYNFITENKKFLYLSYPNIGDNCSEEAYNKYFNQLDTEVGIYDKTEKLIFETDFIKKIPNNVLNFRNLKEIDIRGARFWELDCSHIPISIEVLRLIEHSNLHSKCINGMDKLINLTTLDLNCKPFDFSHILEYYENTDTDEDEIDIIPIPNLPNLGSITIHTNYYKYNLKPNWMTFFVNHALFNNIKNRINKLGLSGEDCIKIKIYLNCKL